MWMHTILPCIHLALFLNVQSISKCYLKLWKTDRCYCPYTIKGAEWTFEASRHCDVLKTIQLCVCAEIGIGDFQHVVYGVSCSVQHLLEWISHFFQRQLKFLIYFVWCWCVLSVIHICKHVMMAREDGVLYVPSLEVLLYI